jgi:hypothetical protein
LNRARASCLRELRAAVAAVLSVVAHVAIASVLWGGTGLFENSRSGVGEGRPSISWVALPEINSQQAKKSATPISAVTVPPIAARAVEPLNLAVSPSVVAIALPIPLRLSLPGQLPGPLSDSVGMEDGVSGDSGAGGNCGTAREVRASPGADAGPGSDGSVPLLVPITASEAAPDDKRAHDVQFWIRADGHVRKIAVSPPIRDADYRRRFMEAMSTFVFGAVKTSDGRSIDYVYSCTVYPGAAGAGRDDGASVVVYP